MSRYAVIRYLPDPLREEHLNVGVVVATDDGSFSGCRFLTDWQKARRYAGQDISFLKHFADELAVSTGSQLTLLGDPRLTAEGLKRYAENWQNAIQFSDVRASVTPDPAGLLDALFRRFVGDSRPRQARVRDKRVAVAAAVTHLTRFLQARFPDRAPDIVRDDGLAGKRELHKFDLVVRNGRVLLAADALSFEVPQSKDLDNEISAAAWAIEDVRLAEEELPLAVLVLPPSHPRDDYRRAQHLYKELGARMVTEREIESWASDAVARLPLMVGATAGLPA